MLYTLTTFTLKQIVIFNLKNTVKLLKLDFSRVIQGLCIKPLVYVHSPVTLLGLSVNLLANTNP